MSRGVTPDASGTTSGGEQSPEVEETSILPWEMEIAERFVVFIGELGTASFQRQEGNEA
jgi:hypothetical protein